MTQIIRYFSISEDEEGRPTNLKINESYLRFVEITDEAGLGLEEEIVNSLEEKYSVTLYNFSSCHSYKKRLVFKREQWHGLSKGDMEVP